MLQRSLNARQFGLKLIANVTYGYTAAGFSGRMPMAELADAIVQARETEMQAVGGPCLPGRWYVALGRGLLLPVQSSFFSFPPVQSGRETLEGAIRLVESNPAWGARVVYGDTGAASVSQRESRACLGPAVCPSCSAIVCADCPLLHCCC